MRVSSAAPCAGITNAPPRHWRVCATSLLRSYAQVMATVFGYDSIYLEHSSTYNVIVMICRDLSGVSRKRLVARMRRHRGVGLRQSSACIVLLYALGTPSADLINLDVDYVSPSCLMGSEIWRSAFHMHVQPSLSGGSAIESRKQG